MFVSSASPWAASVRTLTDDPLGILNSEGAFVAPVSAAVQGTFGAFVTVTNNLAHTVRSLHVGAFMVAGKSMRVQFAKGQVGLEVPIFSIWVINVSSTAAIFLGDFPQSVVNFIKGDRLSVRVVNDTDGVANTINLAVTVDEAND